MGASPYFIAAGACGYGLKCNMIFVLRGSLFVVGDMPVAKSKEKQKEYTDIWEVLLWGAEANRAQ